MVDRQTRFKKKKFVRTPGGKTVKHYSRSNKSRAHCAITGETMAGMGNQTRNASRSLSATARTPSAKFGGTISGHARRQVAEHAALIIAGRKIAIEVPAPFRPYVKQLIGDTK